MTNATTINNKVRQGCGARCAALSSMDGSETTSWGRASSEGDGRNVAHLANADEVTAW